MQRSIINAFLQTPGYLCWKNVNSTFMGGNNNFIKIAGFKSLDEIIGKTDYDMPWADTHAELYLEDDKAVLNGTPKINYIETQLQVNKKWAIVIVNKIPLYDFDGSISGVICHYYEWNNKDICKEKISLTNIQTNCLHHIVLGFSAKQIARKMNLSSRTIEYYTEILKTKLNCANKAELIKKALVCNLVKI